MFAGSYCKPQPSKNKFSAANDPADLEKQPNPNEAWALLPPNNIQKSLPQKVLAAMASYHHLASGMPSNALLLCSILGEAQHRRKTLPDAADLLDIFSYMLDIRVNI